MIMSSFNDWLAYEPYELSAQQKSSLLTERLINLTRWHELNCAEYRYILKIIRVNPQNINSLHEIPFIPVRLFKEFDLLSIPRNEIFKTMTSSGTTGQHVSKIYLDRDTALMQTKILARLMSNLLGKKRLPMLIIDSPHLLSNRSEFSARGAGILGFATFGHDLTYALDESMSINNKAVTEFFERHSDEPVFIFGFTFMIWQYFLVSLKKKGLRFSFKKGVLLHGGGWKNLHAHSVTNNTFKNAINDELGITKVINYYGMVEQTGSLFIECEYGYLHAPIFSEVLVRRTSDFSLADFGEEGIIQVLSMMPKSYPGHSLLTEDIGTVFGEDDCLCGKLGKYFHVNGRMAKAEIRGCSDAHEIHR